MKHCQRCGLDFPDSFRFCGSCGGALPQFFSCADCGEVVESKWAFCTSCGKALSANSNDRQLETPFDTESAIWPAVSRTSVAPASPTTTTPPQTASPETRIAPHEWYVATELFDEDNETTVSIPAVHQTRDLARATPSPSEISRRAQNGNGKAPPTLTMLSAYGEAERIAPSKPEGKRGLVFALLLVVLFFGIGFGGWYLLTRRASATQSQPTAETSAASATDSSLTSTATKPLDRPAPANAADEEWKRLREQRIAAKPADAGDVITSLEQAEKKYPSDYRFPYERAKLSIKGITSHHEAFDALAAAAEKAIDNGKSQELFDNLTADKDGDFWKLARGHHEWKALEDALKNKDKAALEKLRHH